MVSESICHKLGGPPEQMLEEDLPENHLYMILKCTSGHPSHSKASDMDGVGLAVYRVPFSFIRRDREREREKGMLQFHTLYTCKQEKQREIRGDLDEIRIPPMAMETTGGSL